MTFPSFLCLLPRGGNRGGDGGGAAPHQSSITSKSVPPSIRGLRGAKFGAEGAVLENFSDILEKLRKNWKIRNKKPN